MPSIPLFVGSWGVMKRFLAASWRAYKVMCEARRAQNAAPLASRSHPPALKSGTFYLAKKRNFLFCVDMCMDLNTQDCWRNMPITLSTNGSINVARRQIWRAARLCGPRRAATMDGPAAPTARGYISGVDLACIPQKPARACERGENAVKLKRTLCEPMSRF